MTNTNISVSPTPETTTKFDRFPQGITADAEVRKDILNDKGEVISFEIVTVKKRLDELKATYRKNKLVDAKGREIRFFEPLCRGVSQGFEEDQKALKEKDKELSDLRKKYTVIEFYCNPLKVL